MKVSLNLAQYFSNVDLKAIPRDQLLKRVGSQLGAIEEVIDWAPRYDKIYVAKVVECAPHPDSDHMHICKIDDGGAAKDVERDANGFVQVVCGAPNIADGQTVAWLAPGSTVPLTFGTKDSFELGSRKLRGEMSNGMIGSAHELGISDDHEGILVISAGDVGEELMKPGIEFKKLYGLDDLIIDCENKMFTHRPDCFGNLGVARELAGIAGLSFKSPEWYLSQTEGNPSKPEQEAKVAKNDAPELVTRFMTQTIENVKVMPSPIWLQAGLTRVGIRPINNLVDWSNYYMHLTAQPTHAFDYDKIKAICSGDPVVFPRMARDGEELELLNGKTIKLTKDDIVIATDQKAVALAGIMGGSETEVDENTRNIIVECATFDMYAIRRTSMRHGIFSDAVTRFNKGQSPLQNDRILAKIVADICDQTGASAGQISDFKNQQVIDLLNQRQVAVTSEFINARLGSDLTDDQIMQLLANVEFQSHIAAGEICITPPFWRMDIELPEDIVEEVGRLYGFDKLPVVLPKRTAKAAERNPELELKQSIREILSAVGANEVMTYSFVHGDLMTKVGQDTAEAYHLRNALSPDLQYFRLTLTPSLLAQVHPNIKAGHDQFAIFEMNRTHVRMHGMTDENVPAELDMFAVVFTANDKSVAENSGAAFYNARKYLDYLAHKLGMTLRYEALTEDPPYQVCKPFDWQRSALVYDDSTNEFIGQIGEYTTKTRRNLKLPAHTAGFEISLLALLKNKRPTKYRVASKYPSTTQDITLEVDASASYLSILNKIKQVCQTAEAEKGYIIDIEPLTVYAPANSSGKRVSFRLTLSHLEKTLTTDEVNAFMATLNAN